MQETREVDDYYAERQKPILLSPQREAQTLGTKAICFVSPKGEVTVKQFDEPSFPQKTVEPITPSPSH
ncbi:MAG TPA: hypothetical protein V6D34_14780 [Candidatus Sericytochromatia bacterium]